MKLPKRENYKHVETEAFIFRLPQSVAKEFREAIREEGQTISATLRFFVLKYIREHRLHAAQIRGKSKAEQEAA